MTVGVGSCCASCAAGAPCESGCDGEDPTTQGMQGHVGAGYPARPGSRFVSRESARRLRLPGLGALPPATTGGWIGLAAGGLIGWWAAENIAGQRGTVGKAVGAILGGVVGNQLAGG